LFLFLFLTLITMFLFPVTFYYVLVLLFLSIYFLFYLNSVYFITNLTFLMVVVVYIGAIIILIGYVCAISPNISFSGSYLNLAYNFSIILFIFISSVKLFFQPSPISSLASYFYSPNGSFIFISLIFLLFITLLIVTSYYLSSKGPFRSVSS